MPDTKLSALTAVVTPAATDQFYVNQGGTSKMETRAQIHALESGEHLVLPQVDEAATPTLAFGDGDTGIYESVDDTLIIANNGLKRWEFAGTGIFRSSNASGPVIFFSGASATAPVIAPKQSDDNTGLGAAADDALSIISGAIEAIRLTEVSSHVLQAVQSNVGLTADVGSAQGNGVILSSHNVYSTVATAGDAATLPATFIVGTVVWVTNDGANSMDVFPASGDDAGGGTDTAVAVTAGASALFRATVANATWTTVFNA